MSSAFTSSFAYGLLVGQFSVLIVVILFIRFFIFADPPALKKDYPTHIRQQRNAKVLPADSATIGTILEKTYYNVDSHSAESVDWFTVLIAQTLSQLRDDARRNDNVLKTLDSILNSGTLPDFVDKIKLTELNIGDDYPIFSNCRILQNSSGNLEAEIDVDLTDTLTIGIETKLLLNFPKSLFAYLPISLTVSIVRFSGKLTLSLRNVKGDETTSALPNQPAGNDESGTYLTFSFSPDYKIEFAVKSLVGARSRLQDVPKIGQLVQSRLRKWLTDRCVSPRYQQIRLPSFWPRSKTTKQGPQETGNMNPSPSIIPTSKRADTSNLSSSNMPASGGSTALPDRDIPDLRPRN